MLDLESPRKSIFPIPTSWIREAKRDRSEWDVVVPGSSRTLPIGADQAVYFSYSDPANPWGALSPLMAIAGAVLADEAITQCHWRTFTQGHFPGMAVIVGKQPSPDGSGEGLRPILQPEQRKQLIETIRSATQGVYRMGEPLIFDGLVERVEQLTLTPDELKFLESARLPKEKILQCFHVSEILLGAVQNANRASATVASEIFVDYKINPLIYLLSQFLTKYLAPKFAQPGEKLTVWIEEATAHDAEMASKNWGLALQRGACTFNEYRRNVLNVPDIDGGDELPEPGGVAAEPSDAVKRLIAQINPYTLKAIDE
jgi:phage portal protein BeeE